MGLKTEKIGAKLWKITCTYYITVDGEQYIIPRGFLTDGASNVRVLWSLCPPMSGLTAEPAVLHDWLYSLNCTLPLTRKQADQIFYQAMIEAGVSKVRAKAVYYGVRMGGASSFRKNYSIFKLTGAYK